MVALLLKAIFFYFIIVFLRSLWRGYKMVDEIKKQSGGTYQDFSGKAGPERSSNNGDIIEAEFRVVKKDE